MYRIPMICGLMAAAGVAGPGCAPSQHAAFAPVRHGVAERTGLDIRWQASSDMDPEVRAQVKELLRDELTLDEALRVALLENQELQAVFAELGMGRGAVADALALENPELEVEMRFPLHEHAEGNAPVIELAVMQDIMSVFTLGRRRDAAHARLQGARQRALAAALDLVAEVRRAYYAVQAAEQIRQMRSTVYLTLEASYELKKQLHELGNITELALVQEQALYEQARLDLAASEAMAAEAREPLNTLLGLWGEDAGAWIIPGRLDDLPDEPMSLDELEREAILRSIDLDEMRWQMRAGHADASVLRRRRWLPEVGVGASVEREAPGEWAVGPAVAIQLPVFDRRSGALLRNRAELEATKRRYAARAVEIRASARAARMRLTNARQRVLHLRDVLLPLRQRVLDQAMLQYNAMNLDLFSLLQAKRDQIETGRQYIEALRDYWTARATIDQIRAGRTPAIQPGSAPPSMAGPTGRSQDAH